MRYNYGILEEVSPILGAPQGGGESMPVSKAQQKAVHKYVKENYDRMEITVPKGQKEIIKAHAEARGESVNGFLNRAVSETMERDKAAPETAGKATEPCLHTQEQAVRRILYRHKMHLKKRRKGGSYIVEQEGGSQTFGTFEALLAYAQELDK